MNRTSQIKRSVRPPKVPALLRAFSLVEMMVAVTVMTFIMMGLLAMFSQTSKALRASNNQTDVLESGRMMMEMVNRELQQARAAGGPITNMWTYKIRDTAPLIQDLPGGERFTNVQYAFFFLTRLNTTWNGIGYAVFDLEDKGMGTLYRFETNGTYGDTYDFFPTFLKDASKLNSRTMRRVADGVTHMRLDVFDEEGYYPTNNPSGVELGQRGAFFFSNQVPAFVEIEMGVLESHVVDRVKNMPPGVARTFLQNEQRAARVHLFHQRVPILSYAK